MAARSGPAPWSHEQFATWRGGYKRVNKRDAARMGVEHSPSSGWRTNTWDKEPKKPQTKKIRLFNGRTVEVPDADYEDFIGHQVSPHSNPDDSISQYIDKAWQGKVEEVDGVGHINNIKYSVMYQLLWVEFENDGAVVVFFRVPKEVYSELYYLATSGATSINTVDGTQRHVLGMRFWDIVRIRGQRTGSRYRYEYQIEGERTGTAFSREMAAGITELKNVPQAATTDVDQELKSLYDGYASRMLSGTKRDAYNNLKTLKEKEAFLHKAGII